MPVHCIEISCQVNSMEISCHVHYRDLTPGTLAYRYRARYSHVNISCRYPHAERYRARYTHVERYRARYTHVERYRSRYTHVERYGAGIRYTTYTHALRVVQYTFVPALLLSMLTHLFLPSSLSVLFHSCCSHAQVFGKTLVHEFLISYSRTE